MNIDIKTYCFLCGSKLNKIKKDTYIILSCSKCSAQFQADLKRGMYVMNSNVVAIWRKKDTVIKDK